MLVVYKYTLKVLIVGYNCSSLFHRHMIVCERNIDIIKAMLSTYNYALHIDACSTS